MLGKSKNWLNFIIGIGLVAILIASSWGIFRSDWGYTHDYLHANRFAEYARGLQSGDWPVIWSQNFSYGYGMPMFEFYAPLPSMVGAIFYLLGLEPILITRILFLITNLVSLMGAYLLGKKLFQSKWAGLITSALFTLAPYRAVDLFVRGALSESWAIMSLPWILYGTILILEGDKTKKETSKLSWLVLPLSLMVLMLSHNLSVIMAVPFCLLFAVIYYLYAYFWQKGTADSTFLSWWQALIRLFLAYLLGSILASFYLLSAFFEKNYTQVTNQVINSYFDYKIHFLSIVQWVRVNWGWGGSVYGDDDGMSFFLGFAFLLLVFLILFLIIYYLIKIFQKYSMPKNNQELTAKKVAPSSTIESETLFNHRLAIIILLGGLLLCLGGSLFLTLDESLPIWNVLDVLSYLQFPWRYLSVSILFIALLGGALVFMPWKKIRTLFYILLLAIALLQGKFFIGAIGAYKNASEYYYTDETLIRTTASNVIWDYMPSDFNLNSEENYALNNGIQPVFSLINN